MTRKTLACAAVATLSFSMLEQARAQPAVAPAPAFATPSAVQAFDPVPALRALGCAPVHVLLSANNVFATCTGAGVWSLTRGADGSLALLERRRGAKEANSLFMQGSDVWVQFASGEVSALAALALEPAGNMPRTVVANAGSAPELPAPDGKVLAVSRTTAVVSLGKLDGLTSGDRIEVAVAADTDDMLGGSAERIVVGRVAATSEHRASVDFGFGEPIAEGALVRKSMRAVTTERIAPDRIGGLLSMEATLRPYLPIQRAGIGVLGELAITYRARAPVYVRVESAPLGGRTGSGTPRGALGVFGSAGWDHSLFAVGVGAGLLYRRDYGEVTLNEDNWTIEINDAYRKTIPSFAVMQHVRVGALDGLHASFTNVLAIAENSDEWAFGYLVMRGQIPLASGMWLRPSAGGGAGGGFVMGELGLRVLLRGNGRANSFFLTPSIGVAGIGVQPLDNTSTIYNGSASGVYTPQPSTKRFDGDYVVGPMLGISAEYRIGL